MSNYKNKIILLGYSGHSYEIIECILKTNKYEILGYCEKEEVYNNPYDLSYLGSEKEKKFNFFKKNIKFFIAIGDNKIRKEVSYFINKIGESQVNIINPNSHLSKKIKIGFGNFISKNSSINSNSIIGNNVIINTGSIIEHDCIVKDFVHVAPSSVVCGGVEIGQGTLIGANSTINPNIKIGENVMIGSGSVVLNDIPNNSVVVGNPGKVLQK
jgi:sugar O-acyltransferase (sialic acid O-acetyltransferase NeuD family)